MNLKHNCLVCGLPFKTKGGLCSYCGPKLYQLREPTDRRDRDLSIHSLFAWRRDGWPALRRLALGLKTKMDPEPWLEVASWFVQERSPLKSRPCVLVPVPAKGANHALGFALALAQFTGFPVIDALEKGGGVANKNLSREDRQNRRFRLKVNPAAPRHGDICTKYTNVIIVDDIITTGSTARAAHLALGRPRKCEVWCLMDRRPCGNWSALL